jgi:hypothetical protein
LRQLTDRAVIMHGHRHIDWIGQCAGLPIISAPSPVMTPGNDGNAYFYVHTLRSADGERIRLQQPQRVGLG